MLNFNFQQYSYFVFVRVTVPLKNIHRNVRFYRIKPSGVSLVLCMFSVMLVLVFSLSFNSPKTSKYFLMLISKSDIVHNSTSYPIAYCCGL